MPRPNRTGVRGLYLADDGRRRIDLRYVDVQGRPQRHSERFPLGHPDSQFSILGKKRSPPSISLATLPSPSSLLLHKECVELPSARWHAISQKQGHHCTRVGVERIGWVAVGGSEGG